MNSTIEKFGYPATLLAGWRHWMVLLRSAQPTVGSLVLASTSLATSFADLEETAFAELKEVTTAIERVLTDEIDYARINYLMLMMVDPHVHFHVVPRYDGERRLGAVTLADRGWPGPPLLADARQLDHHEIEDLAERLRAAFRRHARTEDRSFHDATSASAAGRSDG